MPFGLQVQVATQDLEDKLVLAVTKGEAIPMTKEVKDAEGKVTSPSVPVYASRKEFAEARLKATLKAEYMSFKQNEAYDAAQATARAANEAAKAEIGGL